MTSCVCSIDGADGFENKLYHEQTVKARKYHLCVECQGDITPGESYEKVTGLNEEGFFSAKTCSLCAEIRQCLFCSWTFGRMWEDVHDLMGDFKICELDALSPEACELLLSNIDEYEDD